MDFLDSEEDDSMTEAPEASDLLVWKGITSNRDLLRLVGEKHCVVLPPNSGLPTVLTSVFLRHHMLMPSPLFKGQYITRELEDALVENREDLYLITIGSGWKYSCKAKILKVDTFYKDNGVPYKVVFTDRHLLSGGDKLHGIVSKEGRQHPDRLTMPQTAAEVEKLVTKLGVVGILLAQAKSFIDSYIMLPDCSENVKGRVLELFETCAEKTQNKISIDKTIPLTSRNSEILHSGSTLFIVSRIHSKLWPYWVKEHEQDDAAMRTAMMALLKHGSVSHLMGNSQSTSAISNSKLVPAATQLRKTIDKDNPLTMLIGLNSCIASLLKVATDASTDNDVTADDVIPILTYAICLSKIGCLESLCSYCLNFSPESHLQSELGYALTSVQAAIALILQEGKQFMRSSGLPLSDYQDVGFIFPSSGSSIESEPPSMFSKQESTSVLRSSGSSGGTPVTSSRTMRVTTPVRQPTDGKVKKVSSLIDPHAAKESGDFLKGLLGS